MIFTVYRQRLIYVHMKRPRRDGRSTKTISKDTMYGSVSMSSFSRIIYLPDSLSLATDFYKTKKTETKKMRVSHKNNKRYIFCHAISLLIRCRLTFGIRKATRACLLMVTVLSMYTRRAILGAR